VTDKPTTPAFASSAMAGGPSSFLPRHRVAAPDFDMAIYNAGVRDGNDPRNSTPPEHPVADNLYFRGDKRAATIPTSASTHLNCCRVIRHAVANSVRARRWM